ncbi:MAG TPA: AI-2E family transporter [Gemmatimonadales bacterium]|nr:AI-2E family transporter [Gemmatimonadales bacterium]
MSANPEPESDEASPVIVPLPDVRTLALVVLATLALVYTLHVAKAFFLPVVLAVMLDFLLSPIIRFFARLHIPESIGALIVMVVLFGGISLAIWHLSDPVQQWLTKAPQSLTDVRGKIRKVTKPVQDVGKAAEQVESATKAPAGGSEPQQVVVRGPSLSQRVFGTTQSFAIGFFEVMVLLYFLLAAGDLFLQKLVRVVPEFTDKKKAVRIVREAESSVSVYLGTVTLVNVCLGTAIALAMAVVGMPNPILWGVAAFLLEFVPYLGAATMTVMLTVAGLVSFEEVGRALLAPAVYITINLLQANVISPIILGRRLTLNPVAIFVGLLFWTLVWGVAGAFLAVPLLATFKIFCDHIERLRPVGEFLGR